jgi:hypothetical protein
VYLCRFIQLGLLRLLTNRSAMGEDVRPQAKAWAAYPPCHPERSEGSALDFLVSTPKGGSVTEINKALVGGSGDGGVDGVIDQDILGLDRIYIQAKETLIKSAI